MIRINLIRGKRKPRREVRAGSFVAALPLVVLVGLFVHYRTVSARIESLRLETSQASAKIEQLKKQIAEVEKFKVRKAELQKKVDIISNLQRDRTGLVPLFEALSGAIPEKCWLEQLSLKGTKVDLVGMAINNDTIAAFMTALGKTGRFRDVVLGSADQVSAMGTKLMKFNLTFQVVPEGPRPTQ